MSRGAIASCRLILWLSALPLVLGGLGAPPPAQAQAVPVELVESDGSWTLLRGGRPYSIKGAGGKASLEILIGAGGNSVRTWGADDLDARLDAAHRAGVSVAVGIWLGHERHGFDYTDATMVAEQYERARDAILRYRDHPALLLWGIGNEMEGFAQGDNAAIWSAVNNIAALAKKLDPNHPTMTVTADIGGERVANVHRLCPDIDIMGINSYGGAPSLPERYRKAGGTKPYLVTETGPPGVWEVGRNAWEVPEELTSTAKGPIYTSTYETLAADSLCLGSYVFLWGQKQEATATWFGMFLPDGSRLEAVDAMTEAWSGKPPANRVPKIIALRAVTPAEVDPGGTVRVELEASDPEGDALDVAWALHSEMDRFMTGGDEVPGPPAHPEALIETDATHAVLRMPSESGPYRLYVYVRDGQGGAATANLPLRVKGGRRLFTDGGLRLPVAVYEDGTSGALPWAPSGYMGEHRYIELDAHWRENPQSGETCMRIDYDRPDGWCGVVWQDPPNDWGKLAGGHDLGGALRLSFWARGEAGGEKLKVGFGLLGSDVEFSDSAKKETEIVLRREWRQYVLDLAGKDLSRIKSGFYWVLGGQGSPVTFYLDAIRYQ